MQLHTSCSRLQATQHSKETPQDCKQEEKNLNVNRVDDRHDLSAAEEQFNGRKKAKVFENKTSLTLSWVKTKKKYLSRYKKKAMSCLALNPFVLKK